MTGNQNQGRRTIWSGNQSNGSQVCVEMRQEHIPADMLKTMIMEICLESGSGEHTMSNQDYIDNIRQVDHVMNMIMNAGDKKMDTVGDIHSFEGRFL